MSVRCYGCMKIKENSPICEHCGFDERTQNNSHQLPIGTVVGEQYVLGKILGQGGFGITYIGWDLVMNQRVAIKEYFPSGYAGRDTRTTSVVTSYDHENAHSFEENKRRFLREAESLAKLWSIPQVVRVLRHFEENGTAYIVMEYVDGMDLRRFMKHRGEPLTLDAALEILGPVIQALNHVHKAELVHRDISPDNIMVLPDGSAKLLDFGAARYVENADTERERQTSTQAILKQGFAPPEQYRSHGALGPWTDIYAMCATLYYCLSGRVPPESMSRMMDEVALDLEHLPGLTPQQKAALEKGMALKPKERIKSAEDLYQALFSELLGSQETAVEETQETEDPDKPRHTEETIAADTSPKTTGTKKKPAALLAVAAAVIALVVSARLIGSSAEESTVQLSTEPEASTAAMTQESVPETNFEEAPAAEENYSELNLELEPQELGYTQPLSLLSSPEEGTVSWSSSNPEVVTISDDGTMTARGYGIAQVTASSDDQVAVCQVYIFRKANIDLQLGGNASTRAATDIAFSDVILPGVIDGTVIKRIGPNTFEAHQEIHRVVIPDMVEAIEKRAFNNCTNLSQVVFPQRLTRIARDAFAGTALTNVVIPEGVTELEWGTFYGCNSLQSVVLPESLTVMGGSIFTFCSSLTEVNIPSGITAIDHDTFLGCTSLREIIIPNNIKSIGNRAFGNCKQLKTVTFSESIWKIPLNGFENCSSLEEVVLPENITVIEESAFRGCSMLSKVTIPPTVIRIEAYAFGDCHNLQSVTVSASCQIAAGAFPPTCLITYYES